MGGGGKGVKFGIASGVVTVGGSTPEPEMPGGIGSVGGGDVVV